MEIRVCCAWTFISHNFPVEMFELKKMTCIITLIIYSYILTHVDRISEKKKKKVECRQCDSANYFWYHANHTFLISLAEYVHECWWSINAPHLCIPILVHKSLLSFTLSYASSSPFYIRMFIEFHVLLKKCCITNIIKAHVQSL